MNGTSTSSPSHVWLIPEPHMTLLIVTEYEKAAVDSGFCATCSYTALIIQPFVPTIIN